MPPNILGDVIESGDTLTPAYLHAVVDDADIVGIGPGDWAGGDYRLIQPDGATLPTEPALLARGATTPGSMGVWADTGPTWSRMGLTQMGVVQVRPGSIDIPKGGPFYVRGKSVDQSDLDNGQGGHFYVAKFLPVVGVLPGDYPDGMGGPYVNLGDTCGSNGTPWLHRMMQTWGWCDVYVQCSGATASPGDPIIMTRTNDYFWAVAMSAASFGASGSISGVLCGKIAQFANPGHDGLARCFFTGAQIWKVLDEGEIP
jgi:hypothetical protein